MSQITVGRDGDIRHSAMSARQIADATNQTSLNPCCNGRWSRTRPYKTILIISKLKNFTKQILTFLNRKLTIP